jgi:hypothetical protein
MKSAALAGGAATLDKATAEPNSPEYHFLQSKFSSGVRFTELKSIAQVAAALAGVEPPNREMRRHFHLLMQWYRTHMDEIAPFLLLIQLRDARNLPIDGTRELVERHLI